MSEANLTTGSLDKKQKNKKTKKKHTKQNKKQNGLVGQCGKSESTYLCLRVFEPNFFLGLI